MWETNEGPTAPAAAEEPLDASQPKKGRRGRRARKGKEKAAGADAAPTPESTTAPQDDWSIPIEWLGPDRVAHLQREAGADPTPPAPATPPPTAEPVDVAPPSPHAAPEPPAASEPPPAPEPLAVSEPLPAPEPLAVSEPLPAPEPPAVSEPPAASERPPVAPAPSGAEAPHASAGFAPRPGFEAQPLVTGDDGGLAERVDSVLSWVRDLPPRRVALAVGAVVVVIGALVATRVVGGGTVDAELSPVATPLGAGTVSLPEGCETAPVAEESEVRVAAVECALGGGASLTAIEMDFRQAQADRLETRFLAETVLAARREAWPAASVDSFEPAAPPAGWEGAAEAATFTGRVGVGGEDAQTVGHLVVADNQAVMVVARADDRTRVEALVAESAASLSNAAPEPTPGG